MRLLAPIMSFTAEEVWQHLPQLAGRPESVHLAGFPEAKDLAIDLPEQSKTDWDTLLALRPEVLKALEEARQNKLIGSGLEARVKIAAGATAHSVLERNLDQLRALFIVSHVELEKDEQAETGAIAVTVAKADGEKCERCWNYSVHVGENTNYPTICERCSAVLTEIESSGATGQSDAASQKM